MILESNGMNQSISWLYAQYTNEQEKKASSITEQCYLCGSNCEREFTVGKGIADTFNSHYLAQCPSSPWLCPACQWYFDNKAGHPDFRKMSLVVSTQSWQNWDRATMKQDIEQWLMFGVPDECYLVCSLSKKKHILLQAPLNAASTRNIAIQVEEQVAYPDLWTWRHMNSRFMQLLRLGHGKGEILSGNLYSSTLKKHGQTGEALRLSRELDQYRNGVALELLSYATIIEKEEKFENDGIEERIDRGASTIPEGIRNQTNSSSLAPSGMERHRQGVLEQVQNGDMEDVRRESSNGKQDYQQLDLFSL